MALKEDYLDDILNTSINTQRKYRMITNADGTISLEDVTEYSQNGDNFGSADVNAITKAINELILSGNLRYNEQKDCLDVKKDGEWIETNWKFGLAKQILFSANDGNVGEFVEYAGSIVGSDMQTQSPSVMIGSTMVIKLDTTTTGYRGGSAITGKYYDLTNVNKVFLDYTATSTGTSNLEKVVLFVTQTKGTYIPALATTTLLHAQSSKSDAIELDVSSISGECYIGIELDANAKVVTVNVNEMYLE